MSELRPTPKLNQQQIEALYVQASRNNDGTIVTASNLGLDSAKRNPDCLQTITGSCTGCAVYEYILNPRLRRRGEIPTSKVIDKFSDEWCPAGESAQLTMKENNMYFVNYKLTPNIRVKEVIPDDNRIKNI